MFKDKTGQNDVSNQKFPIIDFEDRDEFFSYNFDSGYQNIDRGLNIDELYDLVIGFSKLNHYGIVKIAESYNSQNKFMANKDSYRVLNIGVECVYHILQKIFGSDYPDSGANSSEISVILDRNHIPVCYSFVDSGFDCYSGGGVSHCYSRSNSYFKFSDPLAFEIYKQTINKQNDNL